MPDQYDPKPYTTRRLRLKDFDYRTPGYYFITICQKDRRHLFSHCQEGVNHLTPAGMMAAETTSEIPAHHPNTIVDASIIMPNHVHLLLGINLAEDAIDPDSVIDVLTWWKTITTNRYIWGVKDSGWPRYDGSLWQQGYHDRIVRDQRELESIRYYIEQNPTRWLEDTYYDEV